MRNEFNFVYIPLETVSLKTNIMATYNKTLKLLASKLGLSDEDKVLKKAAEFERLLQTKSIAGNVMTDTSKTVICLDLAAAIFGADLDNKTAIKYSGLKAPTYANCRKVVENLLELNSDKLTVPLLCVTLQCTGIQSLAEKILKEYQRQAKTEIDLNLPQYVCMAVFQACRLNKVKISKSKIIEKSRLKPAQWVKLDADWTKIIDEKFANVKKKGRKTKNAENIEENVMEVDTPSPKEEKQTEPQIEPYDDWKKRMLDTAYKELKEMEKKKIEIDNEIEERKNRIKEFTSPRRSPRKTPQKFSPYKSPRQPGSGIRLLFPKEL